MQTPKWDREEKLHGQQISCSEGKGGRPGGRRAHRHRDAGVPGRGRGRGEDGDVIRTGSCTNRSDWKLKLSPENGRIEVEFEVDSNVNGQNWHVKLKKDGNVFFNGTKTTKAPSGSFEVRRVVNNGAGTENFVAKAVNNATGEVCRGTANF